jgi:tight adherence protein B
MNNYTYALLFIIPILAVLLVFYFYSWYENIKVQKRIIDSLSSEGSLILENKAKNKNDDIRNSNWLRKKMNYAGFESVSAPYAFVLISITTGVLIAAFVYIVIESTLAFIASVALFSLLPLLILVKIIRSRESEFNLFLKEIIDKVTSMMKSGVGFEQGLKKSILTTHSKFTKKVFDIYLNEKEIIGEDKAFEKMFRLVDSKELRIFYLTISIGKSSGGKFSNTL